MTYSIIGRDPAAGEIGYLRNSVAAGLVPPEAQALADALV